MDPYGEPPSKRQLKKSGTSDWLEGALAEQKQRENELLGVLGGVGDDLSAERDHLASLLDLPPELEGEHEPAPDLFSAEREQGLKRQAELSSLLEDVNESKAAEKAMLENLFGNPKKKK